MKPPGRESWKILEPEGVARPAAPYSPGLIVGDFVFLSGQIPAKEDGTFITSDFVAQAHQVFRNLQRCLDAAGGSLDNVVRITTYLSSFDYFQQYNDVYLLYFRPPFPARTTIQVGLYGFDIEVDAVAVCS